MYNWERTGMLNASCPPHRCYRRRGFTLLETLLALGLCSVLLVAVASSIQLYWNYRVRSESRINNAILMRAVNEDLQCDLRAGIRKPLAVPEPFIDTEAVEPVNGADDRLITESRFREQLLQLDLIPTVEPVRFAGGPDWLLILTGDGSPRFPSSASSSRLRHILWFFNHGRSLQIPVSGTVEKPRFTTVNVSHVGQGLIRRVVPVTASVSDAFDGDARNDGPIARISAMHLAYFDGQTWKSSWPLDRSRSLPLAVRVTWRLSDDVVDQPPTTILLVQASPDTQENQP
jgi:prepilin-type N-terminal cleavage/methylation domain-containing protein